MKFIVALLIRISRFSRAFPISIAAFLVVASIIGYAVTPLIKISTDLIAGVVETNPVIKVSRENNEFFGEQDSLIIVIEFPEPPGEDRMIFLRELGESVAGIPGVRRVRYQFLDPENREQVRALFTSFLLGMNERERESIKKIFSPEGIENAFRRNRNRLFLADHPFLKQRILEDPLELSQFLSESMKSRVGDVSLGDVYLLIASPDSTTYIIQVTPDFLSTDLVKGEKLTNELSTMIPRRISELFEKLPNLKEKAKGIKWYLTGKTVFHHESSLIFDRETTTILVVSFALVLGLLLYVYRSLWSALILLTPISVGIGINYGLVYLLYTEVNPVVMGATGVLFGLATDYGVHLWGRLRAEIDNELSPSEAVEKVYSETGPPVIMGALTSILAFLCLCLSDQPAMSQFGYVGACGLLMALMSTVFMFPALVEIVHKSKKDRFPKMKVSFEGFSGLFIKRPKAIIAVSIVAFALSVLFMFRVSYEPDVFKVFLARGMDSMAVSEKISRKFGSNFSQPSVLSFEVEDFDKGLEIQRELDHILEKSINTDSDIASVDSISYLLAPESSRTKNKTILTEFHDNWPHLTQALNSSIMKSDLSDSSIEVIRKGFESVERLLLNATDDKSGPREDSMSVERSWYTAKIRGKYRFLTYIRYSNTVADPEKLKAADEKILAAVKNLSVPVQMSGARQSMEVILSSLVSELVKLGTFVTVSVSIFFFAVFGHPVGVLLSMGPMIGAFCMTMGLLSALGMGLPFSIVGVAPLIFGLSMDNGVHVVMGTFGKERLSVVETMARVSGPIIFTSLTNVMGFVAMLTSKHYSLEFLGWAMVIGMFSGLGLTLTTLPAILLLMENKKLAKTAQV